MSQELKDALKVILAVADSVREMGAQGAPEGPMFLAWQQKGGTLSGWQKCLDILILRGIIERKNHVLYYIDKGGK